MQNLITLQSPKSTCLTSQANCIFHSPNPLLKYSKKKLFSVFLIIIQNNKSIRITAHNKIKSFNLSSCYWAKSMSGQKLNWRRIRNVLQGKTWDIQKFFVFLLKSIKSFLRMNMQIVCRGEAGNWENLFCKNRVSVWVGRFLQNAFFGVKNHSVDI